MISELLGSYFQSNLWVSCPSGASDGTRDCSTFCQLNCLVISKWKQIMFWCFQLPALSTHELNHTYLKIKLQMEISTVLLPLSILDTDASTMSPWLVDDREHWWVFPTIVIGIQYVSCLTQITNCYVRPPATDMSVTVTFFSSLAFSLMLTAEFFTFILKQMKDLPGWVREYSWGVNQLYFYYFSRCI